MFQLDPKVAQFLIDIATALNGVKSGKVNYGEFHVMEVVIGFDGERTDMRIVPDDFGGYAIQLGSVGS